MNYANWNQFVVEMDSSKISEISKFNYLLELVEGGPKSTALGCHTALKAIMKQRRFLK